MMFRNIMKFLGFTFEVKVVKGVKYELDSNRELVEVKS